MQRIILLKIFILFTLSSITSSVFATNKIDSLLKRVEKTNPNEQIGIYIQIATQLVGAYDSSAIQYAEKSLQLSKKIGDKKGEAIALSMIGGIQTRLSTDSTALKTLLESLSIFESLGNPFETTDCYARLCAAYLNLNDISKAQESNFMALAMARKYKKPDHEAYILSNISSIYLAQDEFALALDNLLASLEISEKKGDKKKLAYCLYQLAYIYETIQMDSIAEKYYLRSLNTFIELNHPIEESMVYANLGNFYSSIQLYSKAEDCLRSAIKIYNELALKHKMVQAYSSLGNVFAKQNILDSADFYYQKSIQLAEEFHTEQHKAQPLLGIGKSLYKRKNYSKAEEAFIESEELAKKYNLIETRRDALLSLSKIDSIYRRFEQSRDKLSKAQVLINYLNEENSKRLLAEMTVRYETEKKEKEIKTQQSLLRKQRTLIVGLILFTIAIIGLITMIYRQYIIKRRNNLLLAQQKAEIDEKNRKLNELDEIKTRFFTNLSHEFRTPLTIISGNLELLCNKEVKSEQDMTNYQTMLHHSRRLLDLVNQLLEISKIEKGKMRLSIQHGDISQFVRILASSYSSWSSELEIDFNFDNIEKDIVGWFDADKLEKIIANLLSNAFKFTPPKGKVWLELSSNSGNLIVNISDTGEGLNEKDLSHIWELFYQGYNKTNAIYEGSGIGLTLVKELVQSMNGSIKVSSQPGKGTKFDFKIPLNFESTENVDIIDQSTSFTFEKPSIPRLNNHESEFENLKNDSDQDLILVVEDSDDLRYFITSNLNGNYRIIEAQNGKEGFEKATETIPDLIISDVMMPEMDGLELTSKIKNDERTSHIPVIILTAKVSPDNVIEGLESGADEYLPKPFSIKELSLRIRNLLATRQQLRDKFQKTFDINLSEIKVSSLDEKLIQRALSLIEQHMDDSEYEVIQFCNDMNMSRATLHRKLKAITNQSTTEFIRNVRLRRAASLLKDNAGNVSEIAYQTGFNNLSYFAKSFKELFGVTPSEYSSGQQS